MYIHTYMHLCLSLSLYIYIYFYKLLSGCFAGVTYFNVEIDIRNIQQLLF